MSTRESRGAFGPGGAVRATWPFRRTVLAVVHHLTAGTRLADVLPLIESDPRVQVVYTVPPTSPFSASGERWVRELDAQIVPWNEVRHYRFELAVAAHHGGLERIDGPVLSLEHGIGSGGRLEIRRQGHGPESARPAMGLSPSSFATLGRLIPSAIGVGHETYRDAIARVVPEARPITHLVGDPCLDRMLVSLEHRESYRAALGVSGRQQLIVVSSTWTGRSLLGTHPELPRQLVRTLPQDRYRTVLVLHPSVWSWHGKKQVRDWIAGAQAEGLQVLGPEEGWRAALVASDLAIGDEGSVTCYAASLGKPVIIGAFSDSEVVPGTPWAALGASCPRLQPDQPLAPQISQAMLRHSPAEAASWRSQFTSAPGESAQRLRALMYRMLDLAEPTEPAVSQPVPPPVPLAPPHGWGHGVRGVAA